MSVDQTEINKKPAPASRPDVFYKLGQIIGTSSGVVTCILWTLAMWDPASGFSFSFASFAVVFVMILIAIIAVIASTKGHGKVLIVLFAISFFPIGMYVLAIPHWLHWVGLANIGLLVAGLLIRRGIRDRGQTTV